MGLEYITKEPSVDAEYVVIWLHGLGADGHDFEPIVQQLQLPELHTIRFIFPHAPIQPVTINQGMTMRAWYDIYGFDLQSKQDEEGIQRSEQLLLTLIEEQVQQGIPTEKIILAGFSQGGAIVLHTVLRLSQKIAGVMALSTYLPLVDKAQEEKQPTNKQTPIFIGHGQFDPVVPMGAARDSYECLTGMGYAITWHEYPMEHSVCLDEIQHIRAWLQKIVGFK